MSPSIFTRQDAIDKEVKMAEIIIKNPDAPATKKQLFALFIATGIDHRGKGLTVKEASELPISNLKNGNEKK